MPVPPRPNCDDVVMRVLVAVGALLVVVGALVFTPARADGSGLGPPSALVVDACRDVAARAAEQDRTYTVYCPPLVPQARGIRLEWAGSIGGSKELNGGYAISFASRVVGGASGWGGHWTLDVGQPAILRRLRKPFPQVPEELIRLRNRDVGVYRVAADIRSFYAGHVVYAWQESGRRFHLTVHGYEWEARLRRMASALMAAIDRCTARPSMSFCSKVIIRPRP